MRSQRLAQRPRLDDALWVVAPRRQCVGQTAARVTEDARGMGLIDQEQRVMPAGHLKHSFERGQVAVHAKDRIGNNQPAPGG